MYNNKTLNKVRVWDLPTRIFHWALVAGVLGLAISGTLGGNAMIWHFRFGYAVLTLLLFRIVWGLVGGRWSRFGAFIYSPQSVFNYLKGRGKAEHSVGHSPIGAGSVFAMLGFLLAQVGTGLLSDDEIAFAGPLTRFVSNASGQPGHQLPQEHRQVDCAGAGAAAHRWPSFSTSGANTTWSAPCCMATRSWSRGVRALARRRGLAHGRAGGAGGLRRPGVLDQHAGRTGFLSHAARRGAAKAAARKSRYTGST